MPIFPYKCTVLGHVIEIDVKVDGKPVEEISREELEAFKAQLDQVVDLTPATSSRSSSTGDQVVSP